MLRMPFIVLRVTHVVNERLFKEIEEIRVVVCQQTGLHEGVC